MVDVTPEDLRAAVAAGRIDEATAAGLAAFAAERQGLRAAIAEEDEPFEFFRGFGEIFVSVGLVLLLGAVHAFGMLVGGGAGAWFASNGTTAAIVAGMTFLLALYFTRRRRMSLPSIVLAAIFAIEAGFAIAAMVDAAADWPDGDAAPAMAVALIGGLAMLGYYRLFRLPFALAPLGLYAAGFVIAAAYLVAPRSEETFAFGTFDIAQAPTFSLAVLLFGVGAFLVAMRFDMQDPHRLGRKSAAAFWLHILAAPAIVNTVCLSLYNLGGPLGYASSAAAFLLVALLALLVDRRSFLMAGVVYAGLVIAAAVEAAGGVEFTSVATVGILGAGITFLGARWTAARRALLSALPAGVAFRDRLPPA